MDSLEASVVIDKSKKILQKEKRKQEKAELLNKELERTGHSYLKNNTKLLKYWKKRYFLFSLFDKGIRLDEGIIIKIMSVMHYLFKLIITIIKVLNFIYDLILNIFRKLVFSHT